jgi:hypothetical protein
MLRGLGTSGLDTVRLAGLLMAVLLAWVAAVKDCNPQKTGKFEGGIFVIRPNYS